MHQSETDMIERIFTATNDLMATVGLPNLSIHKIAKEAKISPGTIYLYFKNKDELLEQFARYIFKSFEETLEKDYDENQSFFQRYRKMWWNIWHFLDQDPTRVANMGQYEFLPGFYDICKEWETRGIWHRFCKKKRWKPTKSVTSRRIYCLLFRWKVRLISPLSANTLPMRVRWRCWSRLSNALGMPFKNNHLSY